MNKSIIEKLEINIPFDGNEGCYLYAEKGTDKIIINIETNKLLWAAPEMLEALIDTCFSLERIFMARELECEDLSQTISDELQTIQQFSEAAIQSAIGKSWDEIKELIK